MASSPQADPIGARDALIASTAPLTLTVPAAFCDECGAPFALTNHAKAVGQILCGSACNFNRQKRRMKEASRIIKAVIRWRLDREKTALVELCHLLDNGLIDQERRIRAKRDERIAEFKMKKMRMAGR